MAGTQARAGGAEAAQQTIRATVTLTLEYAAGDAAPVVPVTVQRAIGPWFPGAPHPWTPERLCELAEAMAYGAAHAAMGCVLRSDETEDMR